MELRATFFAFLSSTATGFVIVSIIGALCYLGFSEQVLTAPEIFFNFLLLIPAAVLGIVAGRLSVARPLVAALLAATLSAVLWSALTYALARAVGESLPSYTTSDLLITDGPPLLVSMAAAYFTFRARQHSNNSFKRMPNGAA